MSVATDRKIAGERSRTLLLGQVDTDVPAAWQGGQNVSSAFNDVVSMSEPDMESAEQMRCKDLARPPRPYQAVIIPSTSAVMAP